MLKRFCISTGLSLFLLILIPLNQGLFLVYGQNSMDSTNFSIQGGNINVTSGEKSSENYNLTDTVGQVAPGQYNSNGFIVRAGFQYIYSILPFFFSVSKTSIPFGNVTPETPSQDFALLTVSNPSGGYSVTAIENNPLKNSSGAYIPDTSCDNNSCTPTSPNLWISNLTYGFGYNMSGDDIPAAFLNSSYFAPFPSQSDSESAAVVMSSQTAGSNREATINFKLNVSAQQAIGSYQNIISFTALPKY